MSKDINVQKKIHCFWMTYDYAKSMGTSQTLCENVGSAISDIHTDSKASTLPDKVEKKTILKLSYNNDKHKENVMVETAKTIYKEDIGSHILVNQDAKSKHKVINRINNSSNDSIFALPLTIE